MKTQKWLRWALFYLNETLMTDLTRSQVKQLLSPSVLILFWRNTNWGTHFHSRTCHFSTVFLKVQNLWQKGKADSLWLSHCMRSKTFFSTLNNSWMKTSFWLYSGYYSSNSISTFSKLIYFTEYGLLNDLLYPFAALQAFLVRYKRKL